MFCLIHLNKSINLIFNVYNDSKYRTNKIFYKEMYRFEKLLLLLLIICQLINNYNQ